MLKSKPVLIVAVFAAALSIILISVFKLWPELASETPDNLNRLLNWMLFFVLVGVVIEEWKFFRDIGQFIKLCGARKFWEACSRAWRKKGEWASVVGFILLVVGLSGEMIIDPLIESKQRASDLAKTKQLIATQREAASALTKAALIEKKYAWRTIFPDQQAAFLTALGNQKFPVTLMYFVDDPEAFNFAGEFSDLMARSHLKVTPQNIVPLVPPLGIVLLGPNSPEKAALANALTNAGLPFRLGNIQLTAVDNLAALRISIGGRSPP